MNRTFYLLFTVPLIWVVGCANEKPLSGGPKDETPPKFVTSDPKHESTNFQGTEITLTFDEDVLVEQLAQQLIVTPRLPEPPDYSVKRNTVTLELDEPLEDSTTYVFNFREGIKDVTEKNPAVNLVLSLSTGDYIDSMYVEGTVWNAYENKGLNEGVVGLYPVDDTLNFFEDEPYYFTNTDGSGKFRINNIRAGAYTVWAWNDENTNLKGDTRNEAYAFYPDTINLNGDSIPPLTLLLQQVDPQPLVMANARMARQYFEVNYNKPLKDFSVQPLDSSRINAYTYFISENKKKLIFINRRLTDSTGVVVTAQDTLNQTLVDTVYLRFQASDRPGISFTLKTEPEGSSITVPRNNPITFHFSKPVALLRQDSLYWYYDSLNQIPARILGSQQWNFNRTELSLSLPPPDTVTKLQITPIDSTHADTTQVRVALKEKIDLVIAKGAFISIERDSIARQSISVKRQDSTQLATIRGKIISDYPSHILQMLKEGKVAREITATETYEFKNMAPGDYTLRILVDANDDGEWSTGNIITFTQQEPVYYYPQKLTLRANWERSDVDIDLSEPPNYGGRAQARPNTETDEEENESEELE